MKLIFLRRGLGLALRHNFFFWIFFTFFQKKIYDSIEEKKVRIIQTTNYSFCVPYRSLISVLRMIFDRFE